MLKKSPEMVQQLTENLANRAKAVTTGMQEGTLSKWHENELATLGALFGTDGEPMYELQNDEKGHIVANVLVGDKVEKISAVDVFQGKQMSALIKPIKQQAYTDEIVKGLGKQQELKISQGLIKTTQDFDSQRGYVNTMLDKALGTAESPTDIAKSMWTDNLGRSASDFDENSIEEIKSTLMNSIEAGYDKTVAATQLRAPSAGPRETATERRDRYQSRALYELSSLIVQGDPSALSQVGTMNRTIDGKSVTASALVPKGNSLVVVDADGVEIQTIDTTNKEAAMREVAMWVSSSDAPAEVKASFDMGMEEYGGAAPRPSGKAADATSEVVPAYDGKGIKKLNFAQRDTKAATHAISNELPEGFAVAEKKGGMFSDDKVIIMAPNSAKLELNFEKSDPEAMKQELHDFVLKNQVQEKTVYKKGESKSTNKYGI
jgi:nitrate reductase NapAB chaperone NapD